MCEISNASDGMEEDLADDDLPAVHAGVSSNNDNSDSDSSDSHSFSDEEESSDGFGSSDDE